MSSSKVDKDHEAKLAARRVRDKRARDRLDDSYVKKLIRKSMSEDERAFFEVGRAHLDSKKAILVLRRTVWNRKTPEMAATAIALRERYSKDRKSRLPRKGRTSKDIIIGD